MKMSRIAVALLFGWMGYDVHAAGAVPNGEFDQDIAGWSDSGPAADVHWSPEDSAGNPSSGSLSLTKIVADYIFPVTAFTCLPISAADIGRNAQLQGRIRGNLGQLTMAFMANADCTDEFAYATTSVSSSPAWTPFSALGTIPPGTAAVQIIFSNEGPANSELMLDQVDYTVTGGGGVVDAPEPVPSTSLWALMLSVAIFSLGGLISVRQRAMR